MFLPPSCKVPAETDNHFPWNLHLAEIDELIERWKHSIRRYLEMYFFCHDEKPPDQATGVKLNYCCLKKFHKTSKLQSCPHDSWKIHFVSLCLWCPGRKEIKRTRHLPDDCVLLDLSREDSVILTRLWLRGGIYHGGKRRQVLWVRVEFSHSQFFLCSRKKNNAFLPERVSKAALHRAASN